MKRPSRLRAKNHLAGGGLHAQVGRAGALGMPQRYAGIERSLRPQSNYSNFALTDSRAPALTNLCTVRLPSSGFSNSIVTEPSRTA